MSRKPLKGYFVRGQFVAEGSELDQAMQRELKGDKPSRSALKRDSNELQQLGVQLLELRPTLLERLALDDKLLEALEAARRITDFEGRRRQMQFVGKLMRGLDAGQLEAIRAALREQHQGSAEQTALLHQAQRWRDELLADDAVLARWLAAFPDTDVQQLRALLRQARKDQAAQPRSHAGEGPRQGRAYRELYQLLHRHLAPPEPPPLDASSERQISHAAP